MATLSNTNYFSPTQISGCALWLDAADNGSLVLSGGNVSVWNDKSGNGRNAVPSSGSGGTYPSNRINGFATVGMTTTGNMYAPVPAQTFPNQLSAFVVFMKTGTNTKDTVIHRSPSVNNDITCSPFLSYTGTRVIGNGSVAAFTTGATNPFSNVVPTLYNFNISSNANTTWNEWINGSGFTYTLSGGTPGYNDTSTRVWLGAGTNVANPTMAGVIAEVIMYNITPSTTQRQQIEGYLAWKWGLQSNLPSSHPFYNYNPNVPNINLFTPTTVITSPLQVSGCSLWLDAGDSASVIRTGNTVTQWNDKSGNLNHATPSNTPTYSGSNIDIVNSGFFNGSINIPSGALQTTAFTVAVTPNTFTGANRILSVSDGIGLDYNSPTGFQYSAIGTSGVGVAFRAVGAFTTGTVAINTRFMCTSLAFSSGGFVFSYNGHFPNGATSNFGSNTNTSNTNTLSKYYIGVTNAGGNTYNTGQCWKGLMNEIIIFNRTLSQSEYQQVEGYLAWKWGLQSSLPTTHPFYNFNPSAPLLIQLATLPIVQSNTTLITMNPTQISGCALWLDAADSNSFGLTGGSNITSWNDKSGNVRNFSLVGSTNPVLIPNIQNGQSVVTFNGTNQVLSNTNFVFPNSAYTVFSLHLLTSTVGNSSGFQRVIQTDLRFFMGVNSVSVAVFTGTAAGSWNDIGALTPNFNNSNRWALLASTSAPSGSSNVLSNFINGTQYNTKNGTTDTFTGLTIGGLFSSQWWNGYVSEIIIYNSVLPTAQRQQIEGYLAWKWGLQANLPTSHPYFYNPLIPNLILPSQIYSISPSFSPSRFSGLSLWLDAADSSSVGLSGNSVTQWNDKSGNGRNATATQANPTYVTNSLNGLPILRFSNPTLSHSGSYQTQFLTVPVFNPGTTTTRTIFAVANVSATRAFDSVARWGAILAWRGFHSGMFINQLNPSQFLLNGTWWNNSNSIGIESQNNINTNVPLLLYNTFSISGSTATATNFVNATQTAVVTASMTAFANSYTNLSIGCAVPYTLQNGYNWLYNGDIAEILVYQGDLSVNQRQQVEGYLAWKWGLQSNLPANHPYVLFPPS